MIDMPVGTKFYYDDDLIEVVESKPMENCFGCALKTKVFKDGYGENELDNCYAVGCCKDERKDRRAVTFKKVSDN